MCDVGDLGTHVEPVENQTFGQPTVVLYDAIPAGIGFSQKLFEMHDELIARALELVSECPCPDGCPSCVGPGGENGYGGKQEAEILKELITHFSRLLSLYLNMLYSGTSKENEDDPIRVSYFGN
jgi:DEAD/DEAH box helicase domain-containing protein